MTETFEQAQLRYKAQDEAGDALAYTAHERGDRLTADERMALVHNSRWGSHSYPTRKLGSKWTLEHPTVPHAPLYKTKAAAVAAWEILIAKWVRMSALERG